jgi:hypothetical protein
MQEVAQKVASCVFEAQQKIEHRDWVSLAAEATELSLDVRKPIPEMLSHLTNARTKSKDDPKGHRRELIYADRIDKLKDAPDQISVPLQTFRIGDLGIAAIPFETFAEIGLELKERSPLSQMFTIELANGSFGYLPTPEQHRLGGYETWLGTNYVEYEASRKITKVLLDQMKSLHENASE